LTAGSRATPRTRNTPSAIGYEEQFVKARTIDQEKELVAARAWLERQKKLRGARQSDNPAPAQRISKRRQAGAVRAPGAPG
jgi:hypothetical protein